VDDKFSDAEYRDQVEEANLIPVTISRNNFSWDKAGRIISELDQLFEVI
jgi:hypothetical protein